MSLTSNLKGNPAYIELFKDIPNLEHLFKVDGSEELGYSKGLKPFTVPLAGRNYTLIGTAFDFWIRAYIQHINKLDDEGEVPSSIVQSGLAILSKLMKKEDFKILQKRAYNAWMFRRQYILGEEVKEEILYMSCLILAFCEQYFRARNKTTDTKGSPILTINQVDIDEMRNIALSVKRTPELFLSKEGIPFFNPTFHGQSTYSVGGADADLILNKCLIDFKTDKDCSYKQDHINQIIGYTILSEEESIVPLFEKLPMNFDRIGIYYARFNRLVTVSLEELKTSFDYKTFKEKFIKMAYREATESSRETIFTFKYAKKVRGR